MSRSYNVIDADGHILEPFTLWGDYLDPRYRERAPKLVKDEKGIQKLLLEETPVIFGYFFDYLTAVAKGVAGVQPTAMSQLFLNGASKA